ncbi:uncharacterized protein LOC102807827 [Saccoglossus kowalevskii]|uniref:Tripartite motif-containing protein 3-like n=1 Tax=Saccoglossus kowalevskii TaxID=10224 RepID=A0ABM0N0Y3_SACKO|nr:PREDICTED: tripartite motif-containing protein 3-like [Saccoglossus kowalevskii]
MARNIRNDETSDDFLRCCVCKEQYRDRQIVPGFESLCWSMCELCSKKLVGPRYEDFISPNDHKPKHIAQRFAGEQQRQQDDNNYDGDIVVEKDRQRGDTDSYSDVVYEQGSENKSVKDIVGEEETLRRDKTCHGCQENPPTNRCVDCAMDLCRTCTKSHKKAPVSRQHRIMTVDEAKLPAKFIITPVHVCTSYHENPVKLYCEDCHVPTCLTCMTSNHKGHEIVGLQEAADEFFKLIVRQLKIFKPIQCQLEKVIQSTTKHSKELPKQHLERERKIKKHSQEAIEKVTRVIKQRETSLLNELNTECNKLREQMKKQILKHKSNKERLTMSSTFMSKLLEDRNAAHLLNSSKEATNHLELTMLLDTAWEDNDNSLPPFHPGVVKLQETLGTFHKTEVDLESHSNQQTQDSPDEAKTESKKTNEAAELSGPLGVCIDTCGDIVVADHNHERISIIDMKGTLKSQIPLKGFEKPACPIDIAVSLDNTYFVTDEGNCQVIVCNKYGKILKCFGRKRIKYPCGIAINHNTGIVHVVDSNAHCIHLYQIVGYKFIESIGSRGVEPGELKFPMAVAINSTGCLIVSDIGCVQVLSPDGKLMHVLSGCPTRQFRHIYGVATDIGDFVYVCEPWENRVQVFSKTGGFVTTLGERGDLLKRPLGITTTDDGKVLVTDGRGYIYSINLNNNNK